jgi:hypothetical protein
MILEKLINFALNSRGLIFKQFKLRLTHPGKNYNHFKRGYVFSRSTTIFNPGTGCSGDRLEQPDPLDGRDQGQRGGIDASVVDDVRDGEQRSRSVAPTPQGRFPFQLRREFRTPGSDVAPEQAGFVEPASDDSKVLLGFEHQRILLPLRRRNRDGSGRPDGVRIVVRVSDESRLQRRQFESSFGDPDDCQHRSNAAGVNVIKLFSVIKDDEA